MPTDKKFTSQRLDGTGLYYYNTRYYDPLMGRFISPDTIIQSPADPQTLNRYSYCLDNPLKYSDPSGEDVYIGSYNVETMDIGDLLWLGLEGVQTSAIKLLAAWDTLCQTESKLTQYLLNSEQITTITSSTDFFGNADCGPADDNGNISIRVKPGNQGDNTILTALLAHESFHAVIGNKAYFEGITDWGSAMNSYANEILAHAIEYRVGTALGHQWDTANSLDRNATACKDAAPFTLNEKMLQSLKPALKPSYPGLQDWPNYNNWTNGAGCLGPSRDDRENRLQFIWDASSIWYY